MQHPFDCITELVFVETELEKSDVIFIPGGSHPQLVEKAADLYQARAAYRLELALYGALPVSILFLGQMILWQVVPMMATFVRFMNSLGAIE